MRVVLPGVPALCAVDVALLLRLEMLMVVVSNSEGYDQAWQEVEVMCRVDLQRVIAVSGALSSMLSLGILPAGDMKAWKTRRVEGNGKILFFLRPCAALSSQPTVTP